MTLAVLTALAVRRRWARECSSIGMPYCSGFTVATDLQIGREKVSNRGRFPELQHYLPDPPLPLP